MSNESIHPPLVLRLVHTAETNWTMEGTEKSPMPLRMAWPSLYRIVPNSKVREDIPSTEGGGFRFKAIRYIAGCDFIDPVRQDKEGFKPNLEQDNIWMTNGTLTVLREGSTIGQYDYLKSYQGNVNNKLRPPDAAPEFEEVIAVEVAKGHNVSFDTKADAYAILRQIRQQEGENYVYDTEKLGLLATLFDLNHLDSPDEKFTELYNLAEKNPQLIVSSMANSKKELFAAIRRAEEMAVISFEADRVAFTDTKTVILAYKGRVAKSNQINKLADYLLTAEGKIFYNQMNETVEAVSSKSLERSELES